ncbi:MAG: hypothetical protein ACQEXJ_23120 [Myxococcota bacterium]
MKATTRTLSTLLLVLLAVSPAAAEDIEPVPTPETGRDAPGAEAEAAEETAEKGLADRDWGPYMEFMIGEIERISEMDPYGVTSQLPEGYLSVKYQWTTITASERFDNTGKLGPVSPKIEFDDGEGNKMLAVDLGLSGEGGGHLFQVSYGITNPLDWYIEIPFTYIDVALEPEVEEIDEEGNRIDPGLAQIAGYDPKTYGTEQFVYDTLPRVGRAAPASRYEGDWLLGDINTGFSWNPFRNERLSFALTGRVFLPTGNIVDSNNSLLYGTGPGIDTSIGGWAVGMTHGVDVRIFKYANLLDIIFSGEFTWSYGFEQERDYPTNFVKPDANFQRLDPAAFPDLSDLSGTFKYTPGFGVDAVAQVNFQIAMVGLGVGYGIQFSQTPWLEGDPAFVQMAKSLELIGQQELHALQLAGSISLLPFVPMDLQFSWRKPVAGRNAIVMDDYYQVTAKAYIPLFALWR